jgi:hypothetical protein
MPEIDDSVWSSWQWILTLVILSTMLLIILVVASRICYVRNINFWRMHRQFNQVQANNAPAQLPNPAPPQPLQQVNLLVRGAENVRVDDGAEINNDLVSYLKTRICYRERNYDTLMSLVGASRVWQHKNDITDEGFVAIQAPSIAKAFGIGEAEAWGISYLNSDSVRAALHTYRGGVLNAGLKSYGWRTWPEMLFGVGCCRSPVRLAKRT